MTGDTGTCVRNGKGETISAVAWIDGKELWLQITVVDVMGSSKSIQLTGATGAYFAKTLGAILPNAELL